MVNTNCKNLTVIGVSLLSILSSISGFASYSGDKYSGLTSARFESKNSSTGLPHFSNDQMPYRGAAYALSMHTNLLPKLPEHDLDALTEFGPWLTAIGISNNAQQLVRAIQSAQIHGLNPESYRHTEILNAIDQLSYLEKEQNVAEGHLTSAKTQVIRLRNKLSHLLDLAFEQIVLDHGQGLVDARRTQNRLFRDAPKLQIEEYKAKLRSGRQSVQEIILAVQPDNHDYHRLIKRMRDLKTEQASGVERIKVDITGELWKTHRHKDILNIKHRLMEIGVLHENEINPHVDQYLITAIKTFQKNNGLEESGIADFKTRQALNLSIENEMEAISLSLERWRWMPRDLGQKHLFANIPSFQVLLREGERTVLTMTAVVGSIEHQTPAFSNKISFMELNPTWTVPESIANRDLLPIERRKPGYLASRNFDYLEKINNRLVVVPAEQVTADDFRKKPFPYMLRQRGGPGNALGRMKFMMPNPYSIYLHDTQAKNLFSLNERAFSNGCIRLEEPERLAKLLMHGDGYTAAQIESALKAIETQQIPLRSPVPTHLTYFTTWIDENGILQRRPDIYNQDPALALALRDSKALLPILAMSSSEVNMIAGHEYGP